MAKRLQSAWGGDIIRDHLRRGERTLHVRVLLVASMPQVAALLVRLYGRCDRLILVNEAAIAQ